MATPVASSTPFLPTPTVGAPATDSTQTRAAGADSPFQTILAATTQSQQIVTTDAVAATDAVVEDAPLKFAIDAETELDTTETLDAELAGLLAFVNQVLAPPANEAEAQATGQTALTEPAAQPPADVPLVARTRADQLNLERGNVFASTTATVLTNPSATTPPSALRAEADAAQRAASLAPTTPTTPAVTTEQAVATAVTVPSAATFATRPGGSSSIPAQSQILATVIPNVPVPVGPNTLNPSVGEPSAAIAAAALPSTQLGDRPTMAGERFAADAEAGARLVGAGPPKSVVFFNTLAQEMTAPTTATAVAQSAVPVGEAPTARVGAINTAEPVLPAPAIAANVNAEPATPVLNFGRSVAAGAPAGTEVNFGRLVADVTLPPIQPTVGKDESRPTDDATASSTPVVVGSQLPTPIAASRVATEATVATIATPAAQIADTIVTYARVIERDGGVEFQMRLDPPELGRLQIRLLTRGDEVHGQVLVANEAVRGLIESQLPELRQRLEAAGVSVQQFDVSTDPSAGGSRNPYRDAAPQEFFPRARSNGAPVAPPRARVGRADSGSLDVTV